MTGPGPYVAPSGDGVPLPFIGTMKATGGQTAGSFELIEYQGPAAPPPHVHNHHDEGFFILEGTFSFMLGRERFDISQGSFVFVPRGTRHTFQPSPGARALLFIVPSGLEGFFRELGEGLSAGRSSAEIRALLAGRYDSEPVE